MSLLDTAIGRRRLIAGTGGAVVASLLPDGVAAQSKQTTVIDVRRARLDPQPSRPAQGGGAPTGTDLLNAGERGAIGDRIGECWRVDAGMLGLADMSVSLVAIVDRAGVIRNVTPGPDGVPGDPRGRALYERARRALLDPACSPLPVPTGRLTAAENLFQFNFSPRGFIR